MQELTIVVTCTGRKTLPVAPGLSLRDLPNDSLSRKADTWRSRVHLTSAPRRSLRRLYQGEAWQCSLELEQRARVAGYSPTMYVASAGLGLRPVDTEAPGYGATFTSGHADSVPLGDGEDRAWWSMLCAGDDAIALADLPPRPTLLVLSAAYASPLADDLETLGARNPNVLVVGGGAPAPGVKQLVANRALRTELGGSAMSLNQRIAGAWLDRLHGRDLTAPDAFEEWDSWVAAVERVETWDRRPMSDDMVVRTIRSMLAANDRLAWSPALRVLRDSGYACEQQRFKRLFALAREEL